MAEVKKSKEEMDKDTDQITGEIPRPIQIKKVDDAPSGDRLSMELHLANQVSKMFTEWEAWRRPYEALWAQVYRMYLSVLQGQKVPTRAKVFVPVVFQVIEAALPKLVNAVVGELNFFEVEPELEDAPEEEKNIARSITRLIKHQLGKAEFFLKFVEFGKQLLMYGTSYMFVFWKVKRQWVVERTPVRGKVTFLGVSVGENILRWKEEKKFKVIERRPEITVLDIEQVYPDPSATSHRQDDSEGVFVRTVVSMQEFKEMSTGKFPAFANWEQVHALRQGKEQSKTMQSRVVQDRRSIRRQTNSVMSRNDVELLSFWGKWDLDGDGIREEALIVIADRKVLVKAIANPFDHQKRPVIASTLFQVPKEWYGIGMVEPIIPLQHELNTLRNQRLDNINLILNRMWKINSLADVDLDALVSSPNGIILTDDMAGVEPLVTQDVTGSAYNDAAVIQTDIENTTAPKSVQGTPESGRLGRTARGAQLIIGQALEKFGLSARITEESSLKQVLTQIHQLNGQFLDKDNVLSDPGLYGKILDSRQMTPENIRRNVRFRLLGLSETIAKEARINQLISFVQLFKDVPGINLIGLARKFWQLMGFSEENKIIQEAPFPQQVVQPGAGGQQAQDQNNSEESIAAQARDSGAETASGLRGARPV